MRHLATTVVLALIANPALADASAPAADATTPAKPKTICRPLPAPTGSHRPQGRVCKTIEEWRARDRDTLMQGRLEDQTKIEPAGPKI